MYLTLFLRKLSHCLEYGLSNAQLYYSLCIKLEIFIKTVSGFEWLSNE